MWAYKPLRTKHFHGVSSGNQHPPLPKSRYGKVSKFLSGAWEGLTARLCPLLTDHVVRCFNGSDFTVEDILFSKEPITVYLRWPEADLLALAPLVRLVWDSLINGLI